MDGSGRLARHARKECIWLASGQTCNKRTLPIGSRVRVVTSIDRVHYYSIIHMPSNESRYYHVVFPKYYYNSSINVLPIYCIVFDVHDTLQEHSVKFKNIPGYWNKKKIKFKNISAICGDLASAISGYAYATAVTAHVTHWQLAGSPLQNIYQSQSNCLN